jgi:hypothetical protein
MVGASEFVGRFDVLSLEGQKMKKTYLRIIALLMVAFASSCGGWDDYQRAAASSGAGGVATGMGGMAAGNGGAAGAGGKGGSCADSTDCPAPAGACLVPTCNGGVCGQGFAPEGTLIATQIVGDCKQDVCNDSGLVVSALEPTDVFDDGKECTADTCTAGSPKNTNLPSGTECVTSPKTYCDGKSKCVECTEAAHCTSKVCGPGGKCQPAQCGDGQQNSDETGVDCGGNCGATCAPGEACKSAGDCAQGVCEAGMCSTPSCIDGVENGAETDVDCGGLSCPGCGPLEGCKLGTDCVGQECSGTTCLPNCTDGIKNNNETDVDCGGSTCPPGPSCGPPCSTDAQCTADTSPFKVTNHVGPSDLCRTL